jgi:6-pyruvoyltetrahydropterin/6-carboxytetrahydropterin synthase
MPPGPILKEDNVYRLTVRDRVMIAHSFDGEIFGPAQRMHGATYVVEAEFQRVELDQDGLIVDMGLAHQALSQSLTPIAFRNLDEMGEFEGDNTTTEYLARWLWTQLANLVASGGLGPGGSGLTGLSVTLRESDVAWASYEAPLD